MIARAFALVALAMAVACGSSTSSGGAGGSFTDADCPLDCVLIAPSTCSCLIDDACSLGCGVGEECVGAGVGVWVCCPTEDAGACIAAAR